MSIRHIYISIFILVVAFFNANTGHAQCNSSEIAESCISELDTSFHFLKSYSLDGKQGDEVMIEHSYVLTKNTDYLIKLCSSSESDLDIVVEIFDTNRKNVASSKNDSTRNSYLEYDCKVTGIYYLQYSFVDSKKYCAGSAIGFKSD